MANSEDSDQTARAVWSESSLFAHTCQSEYTHLDFYGITLELLVTKTSIAPRI